MMYESPIELIINQVMQARTVAMENDVLQVVHEMGVNVDKEELILALKYDRNQYQKGYDDRDKEIVRCRDCYYRKKIGDFYTDGIKRHIDYCILISGECLGYCGRGKREDGDGE